MGMPLQCEGFDKKLPKVGCRVVYDVGLDPKSSRPRAENVRPEPTGTMANDCGKYGYIDQDNGGGHLFVLPWSCVAFGGKLPPKGCRVTYDVVTDKKSRTPRAENVREIDKRSHRQSRHEKEE